MAPFLVEDSHKAYGDPVPKVPKVFRYCGAHIGAPIPHFKGLKNAWGVRR